MLPHGLYPASVTPLSEDGCLDEASLARLLAFFEAAGCTGAVLAGTNGEGPSLSSPEKRNLIRAAKRLAGKLHLILGISTPSVDEAIWLNRQASQAGAAACLLMAPGFFRSASADGVEAWIVRYLDSVEIPTLIYNFPKMTGFTFTPEMMGRLMRHPNTIGLKDSSGERENLLMYRNVVPEEKSLFVGDETLLLEALAAGWSGSISGAANVLPQWLSQIVNEFGSESTCASAAAKFALVLPLVRLIRQQPQPQTHKRVLAEWGLLQNPTVKLPLTEASQEVAREVMLKLESELGVSTRDLALP